MAGEYLLNYKARKYYTGNGSQTDFLITFPGGNPIETSHVKVFVNGSELTSAWSVVGYGGNNYVRFQTPPNGAAAGNVLLKRTTPDTEATRIVDFVGGSLLKAEDLDRSQLNCLYVSQESADLFLDQGGTAVNTTFDQSVGGVKTFTGGLNVANAANMIFKPSTIPIHLIGGTQYVLAAKDSDGTVGWEETLLQRLPDNVVLTDGPVVGQDILTNKKFSGQVEFGNAVKMTVGAATDKVLTSDSAGNAGWATAVNGVRLGSATNPIKTGIVTITAADIGVLGGVVVNASGVSQVTGPVDFDGSITLGDAGLDNLVIKASMKIPTNAGAGKVLTSNADGFCAWAVPTAYVTSVNGFNGAATGGAVTLTAADVGAVSVATTQTITGAKTFTGNTVIGATGGANTCDVIATLKYTVGVLATGQAGRILTSTVNGTAYWASPPALGVVEINTKTGSVITLIPSDIGAVASSGAENIGGVKTFTSIPIMNVGVTINNTLKYAVGSYGANKFLTSDASGNASWATVPASGIVSVNGDSGATTGGAISITADGLGAVSKTTAQDITGVKSFKASVNLGDNPANQTITIGAPLYYPIGMGVGGAQEGQVLTSDASGKCVWQIPQAAGVSSLNEATGHLTISAASLGAYTSATLPVCDAETLGAVKMGSGLYMSGNGVLNVQTGGAFPIATRYDAAVPTIGGFMVGDNLTINATTGRLDAMTGTGATQVTSFANLTGAVTTTQLYNTIGLVGKGVSQTFTNNNYFTKTVKLYQATNLQVGQSGGYGVNLWNEQATGTDTTNRGLFSVQNQVSTNDIYRGYSSTGGVTSHITGEGDAFFSGTVTATEGFVTPGGMSIGDNLIDGITLSGTLKIPAGAAAGYVLKCTGDLDGTGALIGKAVWSNVTAAPVLSVNNITGNVVITADGVNGLGAVTKDTTQTITGAKTFSAATILSTDCTIGTSTSNTLNVKAQLLLPSGAAVNKIWACNNATTGAGNWVNAPSGFVTSVNSHSPDANGAVVVLASDLGAVTITGNQTIGGAKTFTGTVNLQGNVVVGTTETTNITISSAIKISTGAVVGRYLTCANTDGSCQWSDAAQAPVLSVNGRIGTVVISADDAVTGIGAVTKDTTQTITGAKTFSGVTSFTENMTLGDGLADTITISGTMKIAQDAVAGKVLTCGATGGTVAWQTPLIYSVITKIGTTITATQTGEVIIDAAKIGAATTAQLTTATTAIATAQTTANNAVTAAATAQTTADSKLAAVAVATTANPVGGTLLTCLSGNGTSTSPLKVEGALPIGGISAGDLTGSSYPSPTIAAGKVTYAKMQTVEAQRLLGNATTATANVTEIQLGTGLTWTSGALDTVNKGNAVLANNNAFTGSNGFGGTTTCDALTTTGSVILGDAAADTVTVNATPTFKTDVTLDAGKKIVTHGFNMTDSKGDGLVLTCDANGNGTWKASAASTTTGSTSAFVYYTGGGGWGSATFGVVKATGCPHTISVSGYNPPVVTLTGVAGQTWQAVMGGGGVSPNLSWTSVFGVATLNGSTPVTTNLTVKGYSTISASGGYGFTITFHRTA